MTSIEAPTQATSQRSPTSERRQPLGGGDHNYSVNTQYPQIPQNPPSPANVSLSIRPASVAPLSSADPSSAEGSAAENGGLGRRRGRGSGITSRGRGRGGHGRGENIQNESNGQQPNRKIGKQRAGNARGGPNEQANGHAHSNNGYRRRGGQANQHVAMMGPSRRFGGELTVQEDTTNATHRNSLLQADAPIFVPGQPHQSRETKGRGGRAGHNGPRSNVAKLHRGRRASLKKSHAPDIATRTHEDIANSVYECPICTVEVTTNSRVWSCKTCWTVFHLGCIKKWSTNEGSTQAQQRNQNGDLPPPRQWRCPGCNLPKDDLPSNYTCWCEKETDPRPITGISPHSCGQTCGKSRILPKKCPHPCDLPCHAGPCPPCIHMGPTQSCYCGKTSISRKCVETDYESGWSCGEICGDPLPCGEHSCFKSCHQGVCGACEVLMDCRCYCGKVQQDVICCERGDEKESASAKDGEVEAWLGSFYCGNRCDRDFDCGKHRCENKCHPQVLESPHCPRSPNVVSHCPCGKTPLTDISTSPRTNCGDSIPNCDRSCGKKLRCGHACLEVCHSGQCMPCLQIMDIACRCGRTHSETICHQGSNEPPQCMRPCRANLNCGRHECGERCCSGERKASDRQATKRKVKPLGANRMIDEGIEAEHICTRPCGRMLKCGNHVCPELCHKGQCGSCREAIFEEISCDCGKTVLQPPLPCGTVPPPCRFECERPKTCGHPSVPHDCHGDGEKCPKCPFLSQKSCLCGKNTLKNQPCFLTEVRCGEVCGTMLRCGSHNCRKQCHRSGECEDVGTTCKQSCGKAKKVCGHPCEEACHAPSLCREDKPCQNKMLITCDCQHLKQETKCNASKNSDGNSKKTLNCDDECARLARNQKLAQALNIDPEAHKDDHVPYSNDTLKMFRENIKWAQTQEREFRVFAADDDEKRLRFKPMPAHQRSFLHSLSEDFGLDSESMDPEPHRHVAIFKTPRFVMAPMKTLAECVRIRVAEASNAAAIEPQRRLQGGRQPFNGFLMTHPRFGLTLEELRADYAVSLESTPGLAYDISFLPSEEIVIKARPASESSAISSSAVEASIKALMTPMCAVTSSKKLASSLQLCSLDPSLNIIRREIDDSIRSGGWSQVAAKGPAPRTLRPQSGFGQKTAYTVLGSKLKDAKKKKEEVRKALEADVVDDWEEEVRREEEVAAAKADGGEEGARRFQSSDTEDVHPNLLHNEIKLLDGKEHYEIAS